MSPVTTTRHRSLWTAFVLDPLHLATSQPHQILISGIPVTLTAFFFSSSDLIAFPIALAAAVGVEYAYLKGVGEAAVTGSVWGKRLVSGAFAMSVFAGFLTIAGHGYQIDAIARPAPALAALIALIEVLLLSWIGFCSAILHMETERHYQQRETESAARIRAIADESEARERERIERRAQLALEDEAERMRMQREREQKAAELALWADGQKIKRTLKDAAPASASAPMRTNAVPERIDAQVCPRCGVHIESRPRWLAARKWGHCAACKGKEV